jgi:hypothetical protein
MTKKLKNFENNKTQISTNNCKKINLSENSYRKATNDKDNKNLNNVSRSSTEADYSFSTIAINLSKFNKNRLNYNYFNFNALCKLNNFYLNYNLFNSLAINYLSLNPSFFNTYNFSIVEKFFSIVEVFFSIVEKFFSIIKKIFNYYHYLIFEKTKKNDFSKNNDYYKSYNLAIKSQNRNYNKKFISFFFNKNNNHFNLFTDFYIKLILLLVYGRTILYQFIRNGSNNYVL